MLAHSLYYDKKRDYILLVLYMFFTLYVFLSPYLGTLYLITFALLCFINKPKFNISSFESYLIKYSLFILAYSLIVCIVNMEISTYTLGRHLRIVISLILYSVINETFLKYKSPRIIITCLIFTMALNVVFVYAEMINPALKQTLHSLVVIEHEYIDYPLRAMGLCGGFEACGLINICLMLLIALRYLDSKKKTYILILIIVYGSTFLVSRTSMVFGSLLFLYILLTFARGEKRTFWLIIVPLLLIVFVVVVMPIYHQIADNQVGLEAVGLESSYGDTGLLGNMLFLPDGFLETIVGTGDTVINSDIGYIKLIFMVGIIGLLIILLLYYRIIKILSRCGFDDNNAKLLYKFEFGVLLLLLAFNYKLLFLYARTVSDLFFILAIYLYSQRKNVFKYAKNQLSYIQ